MRIMRIFKLVRHFAGLQSLIYTLNQAYKELGLLLLLIAVSLLTVRLSGISLREKKKDKRRIFTFRLRPWHILWRRKDRSGHFWTVSGIPWWPSPRWATSSSLSQQLARWGQGAAGGHSWWSSSQLVGGLCALLGIFILTLPLPIVVNSFSTIYKNRSGRSEEPDSWAI